MQQRTSHKALVEKDVCCPLILFLLIVLDDNGTILEEISRGGLRIHTRSTRNVPGARHHPLL